ncbi:MAG: hypothetical protein AUK35_01730 [Zetaproteobacteria bacterium CG2_30_46_52]|nr:MAG: hypothetical protein AUK35_01730 [Zetaproteobacteria bacterium CG2_30_46_52]
MKLNAVIYGAAVAVTAISFAAQANEFKPGSVRALGMGGSNVASTKGVDASYWNPAAYGFFGEEAVTADGKSVDNNGMANKDFGLEVNVDAGAYLFGPLSANIDKASALPTSTLGATGTFNSAQIADAAALVKGLSELDPAPAGMNALAGGTVGARVSNYGLGFRAAVDLNNAVSIDNKNVGLDLFSSFAGGISSPVLPTLSYFNGTQSTQLQASLVASGLAAGEANAVIFAYDAALNIDPTAGGQQQAMADALVTMANASAVGDLTQNNTSLSTRGVVISEVGFTYGYAIDENLSVGTVLKYMQADIISEDILLLGNNSTDATTFDRNNIETSTGFGLDLGVMYRIPSWQFGLTARNLNKPTFEHTSGYVYEMKPQAKFGAAWIPSDTFTLEVGYDLTKNAGAVANSESQYWNVGMEWDAFKVLALRVGAFQNTAQSDIGLVPTVGLGLNLWAARIDLAGAMSTKKEVVDGNDVPVYAMGSLAVTVDF